MAYQTPRGTRDFLPEEMIARNAVFSTVRRVFEKYGFYPLETPAFEELKVLTAKCGEDVEKQIFRLDGTEQGLRFDLTVPLARVVASNKELALPFKRYAIGPVWRREEPQKGRFREFWQADVDVVGSAGMRSEAELIAAAIEALRELGFSNFEVRLNNRKLLNAFFSEAGITEEKRLAVFRSLDKLTKMGEGVVRAELKEKGVDEAGIDALLGFGEISGSNDEKLKKVRDEVEENSEGKEGVAELEEILKLLQLYEAAKGVELVLDFSLVRGLDYYTGPIFEIVVPDGGVGSVAGGGRYDALIGLYGAQPLPATGISLGIERIIEVMRAKGMLKKVKTGCKVFVAAVKPEFYEYAVKVLQELRKAGVNAEADVMGRNLRKQLDYANAMGIPFVAVVGEKEMNAGTVMLRDFASGKEEQISVSDVAKRLKA